MNYGTICLSLLLIFSTLADHETVSEVNRSKYSLAKEKRYLIYDTNHGEGFNLRRDVYMRIANTVRFLRESGRNFGLKNFDSIFRRKFHSRSSTMGSDGALARGINAAKMGWVFRYTQLKPLRTCHGV